MKKYYIIKNESDEYFYSLKNFLDTPEFGNFNLAAITTFEELTLAETCKSNLESLSNSKYFIEELNISTEEVI